MGPQLVVESTMTDPRRYAQRLEEQRYNGCR